MAYFPMFVELEGRTVLIVGGGRIAARRAKTLSEFGCRIIVVSPEVSRELEEMLSDDGKGVWEKAEYESGFLSRYQPLFVLAAATAPVNRTVVSDCEKRRIPVNDASRKENCDFYFPGIVKDGEAVIGVTSGGGDHSLAAALTREIRAFIRAKQPGRDPG